MRSHNQPPCAIQSVSEIGQGPVRETDLPSRMADWRDRVIGNPAVALIPLPAAIVHSPESKEPGNKPGSL